VQWPLSDAGLGQSGGVNLTTSAPNTIAASATPHTMGAWTELIATTGAESSMLWVMSRESIASTGVDTSLLLDIGIGGAGSELILVPSIMWGHNSGERTMLVPIHIPTGSRISARCQAAVISKTIEVTAFVAGGGLGGGEYGARATAYGVNAATSSGTPLTTPGATNTKAAWTQIVASTTNPIRWLIPMAAPPAGDVALVNNDSLVDIGYGGSGSEQVLIANLPYRHTSAEACRFPQIAVPAFLPAGTRLAARSQGSSTTEVPSITLIGVD
jgi:hypothetical protein